MVYESVIRPSVVTFVHWGVRVGPSAETCFRAVNRNITSVFTGSSCGHLAAETIRNEISSQPQNPITGRIMKTYSPWLRIVDRAFQFSQIGSLAVALLSTACAFPAAAQTTDASVSQLPSRPARITEAIDEKQLVILGGNVHPLARPKFDLGAVSDAQPLDRMLLLLQRAPQQEAALRQLLDDQLTLNSPKHHAWLTPEHFGAQFGPTDADLQATTSWLSAKGFHGIQVGPGRTAIQFSGTAGQVRDAFHTEIHRYAVNGVQRFANSSDPQIPAALAPVVAGVVSLHNFPKFSHSRRLGNFHRARGGGAIEPLFSFAGCGSNSNQPCNGLGPADLAKIYNVPSNLDGTGQTIAVVGQSNINLADAQQYRAMFGLPVNDPVIILNGPDPGLTGDESEATLDVQVAGAVAPKATIKLVISEPSQSAATAGIDLSALYIVDNNIAGIMSESYGGCEAGLGSAGNAFYNALWEQAAAQGITVLVSSGDNGSAACDDPNSFDFASHGLAINGIASTPFNVAVGGTDFLYSTANPSSTYWNVTNTGTPPTESAKSYIPETPWNDSCAAAGLTGCTASIINADSPGGFDLVAASGGPSSVYAKPAWQAGITGMPNDNKRDIPDVSLFASNGNNNSFYIVCQKDFTGASSCDLNSPFIDFTGAGGTSGSVQAFAGIMALVNQSQASGSNPAPRQGNANYIFYKLYKQNPTKICASNPAAVTAAGCIFYDVTTGNISVACQGGTANCSNFSTAANQYGVMVNNAGTPAWTATSGYDLATGLGTVNIANLANKWSGVGLTASNTTITASPSGTISHGANASFTVQVASSGGTPTGQISLIATPAPAPQSGIGPFSLSAGTATFTTNMLPGGTAYAVVAHYSGDGTFAQSDSAPVLVTVSKESSRAVVTLVTFDSGNNISSTNATTAAYGSPYILRVDVTNSSGTSCSTNFNNGTIPPIDTIPCPTGNVTITDNGAALNDFTNSNSGVTSNVAPLNRHGFFEDQPVQLPGGNHSIMAAYAGDNSYNSSTSAADAISITPAGTAVAMPPLPNASTNFPISLSATVNTASSGVGPTGTITFSSGATTLGSAPLVGTPANLSAGAPATGTATLAVTFNSTGTKSITATYSGDLNYFPSGPSAAISVNVISSGSFNITGTPVTVTAGSSGVSTITITPTGGFTGSVQVTCSGTGLPTGVSCAPNPLTIVVSGTAPVTGALTVLVAAPSTTLSASRISPERHPLYAAAIAIPPTNSNGVRLTTWWTLSAGSGLASLVLLLFPGLRGRKQLRTALGLGLLCVLSFTLGCGGGNSGGGGGGGTQVASHTTLTVTNAKQASTNNNFAFNVVVTSSGASPTGQVQLFDGSTALGLPVTVSNGSASINTGLATVGTHAVSAHYLGNATTLASSSGTLNVTVTGSTVVPLTSTPAGSTNINLIIQ
jgi:Pro-kumamolisin, activation domain/Bacterial Ig-like domain (group 3)